MASDISRNIKHHSYSSNLLRPQNDSTYCNCFFHFVTQRHLENPGATDFLRKHKGEDKGLPFWVILDNTGVLIEKGRGYPGGWRLRRFITSLKKTSNLTEENLNIIEEIFLLK